MIFAYDAAGGQYLVQNIPLFGNGANIVAGAAVMRGSTTDVNQGYGIVGASTHNNHIGVTESLFAAATTDNDPAEGTKFITTPVCVSPNAVYLAEYSQTTGLTVASVDGGGQPTVTSLEDIGEGWLLGVVAPGLGYLAYVETVSTGAATLKTETGTGWTTSTKLIKIMPRYAPKVDLTTTADKILGTTAAQGSGLIRVLTNFIKAPGYAWQELDPTKHDAITLPTGFQLFAHIKFESTIWNTAN